MSEARRNKLAAQIIKAEMMNDAETLSKLKSEYDQLSNESIFEPPASTKNVDNDRPVRNQDNFRKQRDNRNDDHRGELFYGSQKRYSDSKVKKFIESTSSLSQMFVQERKLDASDEAKMFLKAAAKFSRDDMDTKNFSEEIDDSQLILNKPKRRAYGPSRPTLDSNATESKELEEDNDCVLCCHRESKSFFKMEDMDNIFIPLADSKPFLSSLSNVIIRNNCHTCNSFVSSSMSHQNETNQMIEHIKEAWLTKGYRCIIMETYFKDRRCFGRREFASCGKHFQVHCLPIKEKYLERARMRFKQALEVSEAEWSMNRKLIVTDGKRIQRVLPRGLSYFWVCFDGLDNGFGHVIESEREFSRFFGLEVLSDLLDKESNPMEWFNQKRPKNDSGHSSKPSSSRNGSDLKYSNSRGR